MTAKRPPARKARKASPSPPAPVKGTWGGARANSGGPRPGSGRRRAELPPESIARLGPPPVDSPLQAIRWLNALLYELVWLRARGKVGTEIAAELRALAATIGKLVPEDLRADVDRALKELEERSKPKDQGPQPEQHLGEQPSLRGMAR